MLSFLVLHQYAGHIGQLLTRPVRVLQGSLLVDASSANSCSNNAHLSCGAGSVRIRRAMYLQGATVLLLLCLACRHVELQYLDWLEACAEASTSADAALWQTQPAQAQGSDVHKTANGARRDSLDSEIHSQNALKFGLTGMLLPAACS